MIRRFRIALGAVVFIAFGSPELHAQTLGNGFAYQGQLRFNGTPVNGTADFQFTLWDAAGAGCPPVGGLQLAGTTGTPAGTSSVANVQVSNGLFSVTINTLGEFG